MSIRDERDLRAQLGAALDDLIPGPLPVDRVIQRGRAVMVRRRIAVAASVLAVAAVASATPALLGQLGHPAQPPVSSHYHLTAYHPGPGSPKDLIADGRLNGLRWHAAGERQVSDGFAVVCFGVFHGADNCVDTTPPAASMHGDPATIAAQDGGGAGPQGDVLRVRADVAYLRVSFSNGQNLTLRPVAVFGRGYASYVAFPVPYPAAVLRITAYSAKADLGYTVPFTSLDSVQIEHWLPPGAPALPRPERLLIGSGHADGSAWSEYAYVGPWGVCMGSAGDGSFCWPGGLRQLARGHGATSVMSSTSAQRTTFVVIAVAPEVSYLVVSRSDGSTVRVLPVRAGPAGFCAFAVVKGRWTAYSAAGTSLASGTVP